MRQSLADGPVLKVLGSVLFAAILVSNLLSMSHWTEDRGVNDDVCYLRQAHLLQRFGVGGFDTSLARDNDGYVATKLRNLPGYADATLPPCHTHVPASDKYVIQYPPGTGLVLALFPAGHQVVPLYALSTIIIFLFANAALWMARSQTALVGAIVFGCSAIYMMINPTKASYSMAPTMVVCATAGWLTALLLAGGGRQRISLAAILGLLIGFSVNFRLANLFLASGYGVYFLTAFLVRPGKETIIHGLAFALMFVAGLAPTLVSNAINAGSALATTYSAGDAVAPSVDLVVVQSYLLDLQFLLLLIATIAMAVLWRHGRRDIAVLVGANLLANIIFFATHPVFTPYYTIPISALSLWTLLFGTIIAPARLPQSVVPAHRS